MRRLLALTVLLTLPLTGTAEAASLTGAAPLTGAAEAGPLSGAAEAASPAGPVDAAPGPKVYYAAPDATSEACNMVVATAADLSDTKRVSLPGKVLRPSLVEIAADARYVRVQRAGTGRIGLSGVSVHP
ncbi:hypothetical protein ACWENQ_22125 [Nonomuraea sp. NPDC004354]